MQENHARIEGALYNNDEKISIVAEFASKYSFFITCSDGNTITHGTEFQNLSLKIDKKDVDLGRCRMLIEPNIDGYTGQLIFTESVYDLENLFYKNKLVKLQSGFMNLQIVISHKNQIEPAFKNYIADLTYDLGVYKGYFDSADREYEKEPHHIKHSIQNALIATEGRSMMKFLDKKLEEFEDIIQTFDRKAHERHGFYLRKQILHYLLCAPFMARANLKPRGYAGDSVMMSMIYENDYRGDSTFGKIMHKHPIEHPAASAVRNRRGMIANRLAAFSKNNQRVNEPLTVLSVACGPALELDDIFLSPEDGPRFRYVLLDQDRRALHEAAENVTRIEKAMNIRLKVKYLNNSVRTMLAAPILEKQLGRFNFIYSMGLFDYLTPPVAKAVIQKLFSLLEPGGQLIVGNFFISNASKFYMEYWLDWVLYHRSEEEFRQLLDGNPAAQIEIVFEDTRSQMFLCAKKRE
jgi:extracellular factor (EF) 3-hydroxypalmitic acid methyl ester biosynthesis protein